MHLDTEKAPGEVDIRLAAKEWSLGGLYDLSMKGIFEIQRHKSDPTQDTLRWCFAKPDHPRPKSFDIEPGSGHTTVELQRFFLDESGIVAELEKAGVKVYLDEQEKWVSEIVLPESFDTKLANQMGKLIKLTSVISYVANEELIDGLKDHATLRSLRFRCSVAPELLDQLAPALPNLQMLGFHCQELTNTHCQAIQKCKKLNALRITGCNDLSNLGLIKDLNIGLLRLHHCELSKTCCDQIADQLKMIRWLEVSDCRLNDGALEAVSRMENLYNLQLAGSSITDEHLLAIASQPHVRILNISNTAVTNASLKHIVKNFTRVFSVRAENVAFDTGIFAIVHSAAHDRQFDVTVSQRFISREEVESAGTYVARRIRVNGW